jgi:pimeloyl-ACP methyl ester carboxylesterase
MRFFAFLLLATAPALLQAINLPAVAPVIACEALAQQVFMADEKSPARIISAKTEATDSGAPYCLVQGYVAPQVRFELRLPTRNWTQRLVFAGCGGFCGSVNMRLQAATNCPLLQSGELATVTSDLGHQAGGTDGIWAVKNEQAVRDWGHRGVHVTVLVSRAIMQTFYGQEPRYRYFSGCSDGGREGLMTAQRYPEDFHGIVAGAPVYNVTANNTILHGWIAQQMLNKDGTPRISESALATVRREVLRQCDGIDGQRDGILGRPDECQPELDGMVCNKQTDASCLDATELAIIKAMYTGPVNDKAVPLYHGPAVGSEAGWLDMARGSVQFAKNFTTYLTGDYVGEVDAWQITYTPKDLKRYNTYADDLNAMEADLRGFNRARGKLLLWHGWSDPGVPAGATIAYYQNLQKRMGDKTADGFTRLYMLPGVGHCAGGDGPDRFDLLSKVMAWVEDGAAPTTLTAHHASAPDRLWTIAPFPAAPTVPAPTVPAPTVTAPSPVVTP